MKTVKALLFIFLSTVLLASCSDTKAKENDEEASQVVVKALMDTSKTWDGTDFPLYPNGKPRIMVLKYTVPPHCRLAIHKHPVINVAYMLKGELMVKSKNGDSVLVRSGEALAETIQTCHYGENPGDIAA